MLYHVVLAFHNILYLSLHGYKNDNIFLHPIVIESPRTQAAMKLLWQTIQIMAKMYRHRFSKELICVLWMYFSMNSKALTLWVVTTSTVPVWPTRKAGSDLVLRGNSRAFNLTYWFIKCDWFLVSLMKYKLSYSLFISVCKLLPKTTYRLYFANTWK